MVTPGGPREQQHLLTGQPQGVARRIGQGVTAAVVHGVQTGAAGVSEPRDLDRCRLARKDLKSVFGGVPGKVDEDIDLVSTDAGRDVFMGGAGDRTPCVNRTLNPTGDVVGGDAVGIGGDVNLVAVMVFEKW